MKKAVPLTMAQSWPLGTQIADKKSGSENKKLK